MITWILAAIMTLSPGLLLAHYGDHADAAPTHVLSSPWHLPGLLAIAAALAMLGARGLRDRARAHDAARAQDIRHDPR
jgi:membrane protein implicated in regulation of membrane protease activity